MNTETQRTWKLYYSDHRFGFLLIILMTLLLGTSLVMELGLPAGWLDGLLSVLLLAAIISLSFHRHERYFALALGIPSVLIVVAGNALSGWFNEGLQLVGRGCEILFLFGAAALIVRSLFQSHSFTFNSVFGAICGYLFLGLAWMGIFLLIERFQPGSFRLGDALLTSIESNRHLSLELSHFSFCTLTSVGYGDMVPMTPMTRTLAWMEAIAGQFYLAVVVAGLVSMMTVKPSDPASAPSGDSP